MTVTIRSELRRKLQPGAGLMLPGAANALAARLIEDAGFEGVLVTGAGIANTYLGVPDVGLLTLTELVSHVAAMREAVALPLVVDADTGFGNVVNVTRTVRELERAGADALLLEDQVFPKRCGHFDGQEVISAAEMVQKIKAAVDTRKDQDLLIIARTDARSACGLDEALARAALYSEAGADVLFVEAPTSLDELRRIVTEVPGAHLANMVYGGKTPLQDRASLKALGFAGVICANAVLQATIAAGKSVLAELARSGSLAAAGPLMVDFATRQAVVRHSRFIAMEKQYAHLAPEQR